LRSGFVTGGPPASASPESLRFLKERRGATQTVFVVTYTDDGGLDHLDIVGVRQQPDGGWAFSGGAGGSGGSPDRDQPWINLAGWWSEDHLCAGGQIAGAGSERVRHVRLTFQDGITVEDDTEHQVALFLVEQGVQRPVVASLLDAEGNVINTHSVLG
jgi:hypothetical protein